MKQKTLKLNVLPLLIAGAISMHSASAMAIGELVNLGSYSGDPQGIATYSGDPQGIATAINDDGTVMVGGGWDSGSSTAWRFTASTGYENLEINSVGGISKSIAYDVSETGDVVVGGATTSAGDFAFRWTAATGLVDIGVLQGGDNATAYGVNYDGSKIVGESEISINNDGYINGYHAFLWFNNSMADLGTLGGRNSVAYSISKDGNVVVGESETGSTHSTKGHKIKRAFKYDTTNGMGMVELDLLAAGGGKRDGSSIANGVNFDGSVIVGASAHTLGNHAVQWTSAGVQDLHGAAGEYSEAFNVNDAGDVIVGSMDTLAGAEEVRRAFRWTEATGMQTVEQWLADNGISTGSLTTQEAQDVSKDGSMVVGILSNNKAFVARVGVIGSGLITIEELNNSLNTSASALNASMTSASTVINGAHSRPMSRRVNEGEKTLWVAGDWGQDNHGSRDGSVGMAEIGGGYNFGPIQMNVSLGKSWTNQNTQLGGEADSSGKYLMVEGIIPVSVEKGLYATVGTYGHWGDIDIRRGYDNAGSTDYSEANPDTKTWAVRARIDWEDAIALADTQLSPYADLSHTKSSMDAFTEVGGGFPAQFDKREDSVTELRLGVNGALPLVRSPVTLVANLEATHRFDTEGSRATGQMVGLFAFDLEGQKYDSTWMKAGVGAEADLGSGKASLMLNVTTEGEMPNAWLAASYQVKF